MCPQMSRTLPKSLALQYLLEAAVWAESPGLWELSRVAQALGHELSKPCPHREVVFWDYGWNSTFDLVCFMATSTLLLELGGWFREKGDTV